MQIPKQHSTAIRPTQVWPEKQRKGPVQHARTRRADKISVVTSDYGGNLTPLKMVPLLREDGVLNSRINVNVQMSETADMLLNPVRVSAMAYLVPKLALERFQDMGSIDRSYNGQQEIDGSVIPWFEPLAYNSASYIWQKLGLHAPDGEFINTDYLESFNCVWNYIARQRSNSLTERDRLAGASAPAFWEHTQMKHVVPTFDAAMVEGEIPISFSSGGDLPLKSVGAGRFVEGASYAPTNNDPASAPPLDGDGDYDWTSKVWAELQEGSVNISLANIQQATETRAWAKLRAEYQGVSEDWMIDQLLSGIRLNDEALKSPILLDHTDTIVGMNERYATDGENLSKSVADGRTALSLNLRAPAIQCGGTIVIVGQVLPEMIYERQRDYYFRAQEVRDLPNRTSDELDPQPVALVTNGEIDESHSLPTDLFGYAPLNHEWLRAAPNVGGKYFRPSATDPWNENRNRIWSTEVVDPTLGPDFYISSTISHEVFADQNTDPFEWWLAGDVQIQGLTYFGPMLEEAQGDYDAIIDQVPQDRLVGDGSDVAS